MIDVFKKEYSGESIVDLDRDYRLVRGAKS